MRTELGRCEDCGGPTKPEGKQGPAPKRCVPCRRKSRAESRRRKKGTAAAWRVRLISLTTVDIEVLFDIDDLASVCVAARKGSTTHEALSRLEVGDEISGKRWGRQ